MQHVRMPPVSREQIVARLEHACAQAGADDATVLEDVAHVVSGDLRRALFVTELLVRRGLHTDRNALGRLLQETEVVEMRMVIEEALRGDCTTGAGKNKARGTPASSTAPWVILIG